MFITISYLTMVMKFFFSQTEPLMLQGWVQGRQKRFFGN